MSFKLSKQKNAELNQKEYEEKKIRLKSNPTIFFLGLTNVCNLRCPLCATGARISTNKKKLFMDFHLAERIIDKIRNYAQCVHLYNFGESLLHNDFVKILRKVKEHDIPVHVSTNLNIAYDEALFYGIVDNSLDEMIVSFDGLTQKTYSKYRVGGNLELVLDNIRRINEIKKKRGSLFPKIRLQFLLNKYNNHEIGELERCCGEVGADSFFTTELVLLFGSNDMNVAREWLTEEEIARREYFDVDLWALDKVCPFLYKYMVIEQDGSIPPCCYTSHSRDDFGHFNESKSINDHYNSDLFMAGRRLFKTFDKSFHQEIICDRCSVYKSYRKKSR